MRHVLFLGLLMILANAGRAQSGGIYEVTTGTVDFHSDAPQELIRASSDQLKGVLDADRKIFAFRIPIATFEGFNSPLQREHFNENYMETTSYPEATFRGKIIENIDLRKAGDYHVRAKGRLTIHGLEQERIIRSRIVVRKGEIYIASDFIVSLADHDIKIPRVVTEKLAPDIKVSVTASLIPKK